MPAKKDFKHFKDCPHCGGQMGARTLKELDKKKFCSNKCCASSKKIPKHIQLKRQTERQYKMMDGNPEKYIKHLLRKPERKNLPIEFMLELLEAQNGKCALSGVEMTFIKKVGINKVHTNLSIDRIDSNKGYEIGNVQLVCAITNIMKSTLSTEELKWWCSQIVTQGG